MLKGRCVLDQGNGFVQGRRRGHRGAAVRQPVQILAEQFRECRHVRAGQIHFVMAAELVVDARGLRRLLWKADRGPSWIEQVA